MPDDAPVTRARRFGVVPMPVDEPVEGAVAGAALSLMAAL
jgi:hypothetical protein